MRRETPERTSTGRTTPQFNFAKYFSRGELIALENSGTTAPGPGAPAKKSEIRRKRIPKDLIGLAEVHDGIAVGARVRLVKHVDALAVKALATTFLEIGIGRDRVLNQANSIV
jgi:hypothetical protein